MYYVLSKDKIKLNHDLIIDTLGKLYPTAVIEKHHNRFNGTFMICNLEHEKIYIKLNKTSPEFKPRIIHQNIPKNSYIFYMTDSVLNKPIMEKFNLKSF